MRLALNSGPAQLWKGALTAAFTGNAPSSTGNSAIMETLYSTATCAAAMKDIHAAITNA